MLPFELVAMAFEWHLTLVWWRVLAYRVYTAIHKVNSVSFIIVPRDAMLSSCVCPSVRPSHAGIVPKRLNITSRKQRYTLAQVPYSSFLMPKISAKFQRDYCQRFGNKW